MKRADLIRHLEQHGCVLFREGGNHSIYLNRLARKSSSVLAIARSTSSWPERSAGISRFLCPDADMRISCGLSSPCPHNPMFH